MIALTRRRFVAGAAAIPFAVWFERYARAAGPFVRYDARSTQGQAMLRVYAKAVTAMRTPRLFPEGDPRSWTFQWYSHFVKGDTTKSAELARIYPSPSPWKALATEMWDTCQAHSGQREDFFLPWHRMFVFFFEQLVRKASGDPNFTLPYWDYTKTGPTYAVIPPEFTKATDPTYASLYVGKRNSGVNNGNPISVPGRLNLDSLKKCAYSSVGRVAGFCLELDSKLHGYVHDDTGNNFNMGAIEWAAYDPVFWAHHCNIDRIWASWNAGGRKNPTDSSFLIKEFVFADTNGNKVKATVQDFLDIAKLGYSYQALEPVPPCPPNKSTLLPTAAAKARTLAVLKTSVTLGATPVSTTLELQPPAGAPAAAPTRRTFAEAARTVAPERDLYLVLRGLSAEVRPGVPYDIYLQLPKGTAPGQGEQHRVGAVSFFDTGHGDHSVEGAGAEPKFVSFEITDLLTKLAARKLLESGRVSVTFAPARTPEARAKPVVGEISVVEQ